MSKGWKLQLAFDKDRCPREKLNVSIFIAKYNNNNEIELFERHFLAFAFLQAKKRRSSNCAFIAFPTC